MVAVAKSWAFRAASGQVHLTDVAGLTGPGMTGAQMPRFLVGWNGHAVALDASLALAGWGEGLTEGHLPKGVGQRGLTLMANRKAGMNEGEKKPGEQECHRKLPISGNTQRLAGRKHVRVLCCLASLARQLSFHFDCPLFRSSRPAPLWRP